MFYPLYPAAVADRDECCNNFQIAVEADHRILPLHPYFDDAVFARKFEQDLAGRGGVDQGAFAPVGSHEQLRHGRSLAEKIFAFLT